MRTKDAPFRISYPLSFLARAAAFSALSCGLGLWILWWVFSRELGTEFAPAFYTLKNLLRFIAPALAFCSLAVLLVASVAVFLVAMFASHKIAGPLFRLQRVAGYLGRLTLVGWVHLRAGDQGKPVAAAINAWVKVRKERLAHMRSQAEGVRMALRVCEEAMDAGDKEGLSRSLDVLRQRKRELELTIP